MQRSRIRPQQVVNYVVETWKLLCIFMLGTLCLFTSQGVLGVGPDKTFYQNLLTYSGEIEYSGTSNDMVLGQNGFLWIATSTGLVRFDGDTSKVYQVSTHPGLHSNDIRSLYVDKEGQLIIATSRGMSSFVNNKLRSILDFSEESLSINQIIQSDDSSFLIAADKGLFKLKNNILSPIFTELVQEEILSFQTLNGTLWISGIGRLWSLHKGELKELLLPDALNDKAILSMETYEESLWLATEAGVWKKNNNKIIAFNNPKFNKVIADKQALTPELDLSIETLLFDSYGTLWIGGSEIFARVLPDNSVDIMKLGVDDIGFKANFLKFLEDANGGMWLLTSNTAEGINNITGNFYRLSATEGLPTTAINALSVNSKGQALIGYDEGVSINNISKPINIIDANKYPSASYVSALLEDSNGELWVGTKNNLTRFDKNYQELDSIAWPDDNSPKINVLLEDSSSNVLIGTQSGLYTFANKRLEVVDELKNHDIQALHLTGDKHLWVGTDKGLFFLSGSSFTHVSKGLIPDYAIINSIAALPNGYIAASVRDRGILVGKDTEWRLLTVANGLTKGNTFFIQMAKDEYLWGVSSLGVFRTNAKPLTNFNNDKFLIQNIMSYEDHMRAEIPERCCIGENASAAVLIDSMLYVGSKDGMIAIDTETPRQDKLLPIPFIKKVIVDKDTEWNKNSDRLELTSKQKDIRFEYSAIHLMDGPFLQYRYRFGDKDKEWTSVGDSTVATFSDIPSGEQFFEFQASVRDGEWSKSASIVTIYRKPSFIETSYFKTLILSSLIGMYFLLIWLRSIWLRKRSAHIESLIQEKTFNLSEVNSLLNEANANLKRVGHTDALTGLHNRHYLESNKGILTLKDAEINKQNAYTAIVIIDIDYFKRVNDSHGHVIGDQVLQQFALLLKNSLHVSDEVIRWGGEEFLLILHYAENQLPAILKRLCQSISDYEFSVGDGFALKLTVSIGAITMPTIALRSYTNKFTQLFQCSDLALYSVKRNGRNGWAYIAADKERFQQVMLSAQLPEDTYQLISNNDFRWESSRSNIDINSDDTVVELSLVRAQKESQT